MAARRLRPIRRRSARKADAELVLDSSDASLLDIVDNVLNKGVVLSGDLTIALAHVDLIYARLSLLLCAADRVLPAGNNRPDESGSGTATVPGSRLGRKTPAPRG